MSAWDDPTAIEEDYSVPYRVTPGFLAFLGLLLVPMIAALAIFVGASVVASEVYAAEGEEERGVSQQSDVEGWKKTLVFVCPLH
jgi:hypothetical protein